MLDDSEILVRTAFRTFRVRVQSFAPAAVAAASADLGRLLAAELRFGLSVSDPTLVLAAKQLQHALVDGGQFRSQRSGALLGVGRGGSELASFLEQELEAGRLLVVAEPAIANIPEIELTARRPKQAQPSPEQSATRQQSSVETTFEVRFVDEVGQAIAGLEVRIVVGDLDQKVTTNGAGVALLEGATATSGTVSVVDLDALDAILQPRRSRARSGSAPSGANTQIRQFSGGAFAATDIKAVVPNVVVVTPLLGKIHVVLLDKSGRTPHAKRDYTIDGPATLSGTTDEQGTLLHEDVLPGDYTLSVVVDDDGNELQSPVVARQSSDVSPQVRFLGAIPRVVLARLKGLFFETNKSFLLPASMAVFDLFRGVYLENNPAELLVVGHTDTTAEPAINDPLSLERALNTKAFLLDDVDTWLGMYDAGVAAGRRWSSNEDELMMMALPGIDAKPSSEAPLHWFQRTRGLVVDGIAGPKTRRVLVSEYMALDDTSLASPEFQINITAHGCGENFPLDSTGQELDAAPADDAEDQTDRRVELFFFDAEFGIQPPPPGDISGRGSSQYPEWRRKAELTHDISADDAVLEVLVQDPTGQALPNTQVQLSQGGVVVRTRTSDQSGTIRFTGHDPTSPCDLTIVGSAPLVLEGGRDPDPDLALEEEDDAPADALEPGCNVELADSTPFVPPELINDSSSVLV